jgi:tricorn protease
MSFRPLARRTLLAGFLLLAAAPASAQTKLLRFPAISGDRIAFSYGSDIWTAPAAGGQATRVTAHPGIEIFPRFSPDGKWIAFTGQYDGDEQVYVVPATGGEPKQLTWYPAAGPLTPRWGWDNQVYGWTNDGKRIVYRSGRDSWTTGQTKLFTVPVGGGPSEPLPMPESGAGDFSPDGKQIVYSPLYRDHRPEKRYGGGTANDLFIFDLASNTARRVISDARSDRDPIWIGGTIYFTSDRDGTFNLYAFDVAQGSTRAVTQSRPWDVRWPSGDRATGRIVYELNGEIQLLDTKTGQSRAVPITVPDDGLWKRPSRVSAAAQLESFDLSPKGERALFVARGDVFTAPIEAGPTRNLTRSSGAHDKAAAWSPDGRRIAFLSDRTGEEELYVVDQAGGEPEQLTRNGTGMRFGVTWSPDGKRIAFSDQTGKVWVVSLDDLQLTQAGASKRGIIRDFVWSPRGGYLAWSEQAATGQAQLVIWNPKDGRAHPVSDPAWNASNPAWDPAGEYLYYLSDRDYQPQISTAEFNFATIRTTGIYALALRGGVKHPFPPKSDEVSLEAPAAAAAPAPAATPPAGDLVEFDGLPSRVARVPVDADNLGSLSATKGHLLYTVSPAPMYGRAGDRPTALKVFSLKDRKATTLVEDMNGYALSGDGAKVLVRSGGSYTLYDATPSGANSKKPVATTGLMVDRVPAEEWRQIFHEVWRRYRDFFYVENLHGFDWAAIGKRYEALLPWVAHRSDLNYVIQEMISELTVQHAYVEGGDFTIPARTPVALPGARWALDPASGRYRITKVYGGHNEEATYRAPLTGIGVNVAVGDYLLAVDGVPLRADEDPYRQFRGKADRPVQLTVNSRPTMDGARTVTFNPVTSESNLAYLAWTQANRARVAALSGGRVGYLHLPDMGAPGIREFIKWYYGQLDKEGLVVDVRANGGGNVSRMVIERLRRKLLGVNYGRVNNPDGNPYPDGVFLGPMAAVLDERSSSDGDIFPYMFREAGLGPLIGKRSWGGVVGISNTGPLIDGGTIFVPLSGLASAKGEWVIEGYGVDPDIEVENDVASVLAGKDPQLERAVAEVMKQLQGRKVGLPPMPAGPVKVPRS